MTKTYTQRFTQQDIELRVVCSPEHPYDFIRADHDFAYLGVPKCGSMTMREVLNQPPNLPRNESLKVSNRLAIVRHPVPRLLSAWRYGWSGVAFEDFLNRVADDQYWDLHIKPAVDILHDDATEIYRLENIGLWWTDIALRFPQLLPLSLPWLNATRANGFTPSDEHEKIIEGIYAQDLAMWHSAI